MNAFNCECKDGWEGLNCTEDVNDCLIIPCENDGACTDIGTNAFNCACQNGWEGTTCTNQTKFGRLLPFVQLSEMSLEGGLGWGDLTPPEFGVSTENRKTNRRSIITY